MIHEGDFLGRIIARLHDLPTETNGGHHRAAARTPCRAQAGRCPRRHRPPGTWLPRFTTLGEWSGEQLHLSTPSKLELLVELQQVAEAMRAG